MTGDVPTELQADVARRIPGIPVLVHLNGPAGVGKSTVAAGLATRSPLALCVDIDAVRTQIGQWADHPESKHVAREVGFGMAATQLGLGHDVMLPQLLIVTDVIDRIAGIAASARARHVEVILIAPHDELVDRLRADIASSRTHPRNTFSIDELAAQVKWSLDALAALARERPTAHVIDVGGLDESAAFGAVTAVVGMAAGPT